MAKEKSNVNVDAKERAIDNSIKEIQKKFGMGSIQNMGKHEVVDLPSISTGSISIDNAIGIGGIPEGRIIEIYGPESSGKTTLALQILAEAQKSNKKIAFIDAEHALDINYAQNLGIDLDGLFLSQPDYGEQALEIMEILVRSGGFDVIVMDSVAALTPKAEIEGEMEDVNVGLQARLMSKALRKLTSISSQNNVSLIFINQIRMKIGTMGYGSPETTTGGNALKFYASVRIDVRRIGSVKKGEEVVGNRVKVKIVKNKVAPPFKQVEVEIRFGEGISGLVEIIDLGVKHDVIDKAGSWFSYQDRKLGQGKDKVIEVLKKDKELFDEIKTKVLEEIQKF